MSNKKSVLIASDHAGVDFKSKLIELLPEYHWIDLGPNTQDSVDYPDFAKKLCNQVQKDLLGVLICGSGIGMSISANKVKGIRAAVIENPMSAKLAREHNHLNVICLGARIIAPQYGSEVVKIFLETQGSADARHLKRIQKMEL